MLSRWVISEYRDVEGLAILRVNPEGVRLRWYAAVRRDETGAAVLLARALQEQASSGLSAGLAGK